MRAKSIAIAAILSTATAHTYAVDVGGIIDVDTVWEVTDEPYILISTLQVAPGVTLRIQPGVTVSSGAIVVFGTLEAVGGEQAPIAFNGTHIVPGANSATSDQPFKIDIQYAEFSEGSLYAATGNAIYGSLNLSDSVLTDVPYLYLWYPVADSRIERNVFINSGGISAGLADDTWLYITNNLFLDQTTPYAVLNWAAYDASAQIAEFNSFLSRDRIALSLEYDSSAMTGTNNYWGTTDPAIIESMIYDQHDDLSLPGYIDYEPFLSSPHPATPTLPVPALECDANGDGGYSLADLIAIHRTCKREAVEAAEGLTCDMTGDGDYGLRDLLAIHQYCQEPPPPDIEPVVHCPEQVEAIMGPEGDFHYSTVDFSEICSAQDEQGSLPVSPSAVTYQGPPTTIVQEIKATGVDGQTGRTTLDVILICPDGTGWFELVNGCRDLL